MQVPGDPYSPPCIAFSGGNGGATSRGVTADAIRVAVRMTNDRGYEEAQAALAGAGIHDTAEDVRRTAEGLVEYFNTHFQFYGRHIELVPYQGRGSIATEILGGGQDGANADAIRAAEELGAFADMTAITPPYADALVKQGVMAFGAPYMSRQWFSERRPYAWSITPDCTLLGEINAEYLNKRVFGRPAERAGGPLAGQPRRVAIIAPDSPWYQECTDDEVALIRAGGNDFTTRLSYQLQLATLSSQAASLIARLKDAGITSVACACDPVLPVYLTAKAREQGYEPEWLVTGVALTDTDLLGQLYDQTQWRHAFGTSLLGPQQPKRASLGYFAYKSVRSDEPAWAVDLVYSQLYVLALGIHMAGPDLTPETFERGMFAYPGGTGPGGTVKFGPGDYTTTDDAMEISWDPDAVSPYNGEPGSYRNGGQRYRRGEW